MAKLIYIANVSVDGFIEDARGRFDWTDPDDEFFVFITDLVRPVGTYLYGRPCQTVASDLTVGGAKLPNPLVDAVLTILVVKTYLGVRGRSSSAR